MVSGAEKGKSVWLVVGLAVYLLIHLFICSSFIVHRSSSIDPHVDSPMPIQSSIHPSIHSPTHTEPHKQPKPKTKGQTTEMYIMKTKGIRRHEHSIA